MIKKILQAVFCTTMFLFLCAKSEIDTPAKTNLKKPKIIVLITKGGNGHLSAAAALKEILPDCQIIEFNPIYDHFNKIIDGERLYNSIVQNNWIRMANLFSGFLGPVTFRFERKRFKKRFADIIQEEKPDLVISLIPFLNYPAIWAANKFNVPFLLVTLDADLTCWILDMERCVNHDFIITTPMKTPRIEKQLKKANIPAACLREVGYPLRKDFFVPKDQQAIKKEWNIPEDKKVIMLIRGGTGSNKLVDYVKTLVKLDKPIHLLVCIGRNTVLWSAHSKLALKW